MVSETGGKRGADVKGRGIRSLPFYYKDNRKTGFFPGGTKYFLEKFLWISFLLYFCNP